MKLKNTALSRTTMDTSLVSTPPYNQGGAKFSKGTQSLGRRNFKNDLRAAHIVFFWGGEFFMWGWLL